MDKLPHSLGQYYGDMADSQTPSDVAVVMPTLLRPTLVRAIHSIYAQEYKGRIQIAIGVDVALGNITDLEPVFAERPSHVSILTITLPYSTSIRHGGLHISRDGGAIRTILGYAANAPHIAFLDDDNSYLPNHISNLKRLIEGKVWSASQRMLLDELTDEHLAVDIWDSVGPNKGRFKESGGFVDTNCIMVDKLRIGPALGLWAMGPNVGADRNFFRAVSEGSYGMLLKPTVLYRIRQNDRMWRLIRAQQAQTQTAV